MQLARFTAPAALVILTFSACSDPTGTDGLYDDAAVTLDVAASAGDAVASMIATMVANEAAAGGEPEFAGGPATTDVAVTRSRTCYDANNAAMNSCMPFSAVRSILTAATINGTRSSSRTNASGSTVTWTGVVHRTSRDSTVRIFSGTTETARVHNDLGIVHDTTTFTEGGFIRKVSESARDTVKAIRFNLPRSQNPYPVSGSIVRHDTVHVEVSRDGKSVSRDVIRTVEVLFPADAQGNVVLKVNGKTCNLNLVTRAVTNCV